MIGMKTTSSNVPREKPSGSASSLSRPPSPSPGNRPDDRGQQRPERRQDPARPHADHPERHLVRPGHVGVAVAQLDERREDEDVGDRREQEHDVQHGVEVLLVVAAGELEGQHHDDRGDRAAQEVDDDRRAVLAGEVAEHARAGAVVAGHGLRAVGAHQPGRAAREQDEDEAGGHEVAEDLAGAGERRAVLGHLAAVDGEDRLHGVDEAAEAGDLVDGQDHEDRQDRDAVEQHGRDRRAHDRERHVLLRVLHLVAGGVRQLEADEVEEQQRHERDEQRVATARTRRSPGACRPFLNA